MTYNNHLGTLDGPFIVVLFGTYVTGKWRTQRRAEAHKAAFLAVDPTAVVDVYTAEEWYADVPF